MNGISPLARLEQQYPRLIPTVNLSIKGAYAEMAAMYTPARMNHSTLMEVSPWVLYGLVQDRVREDINALGERHVRADKKFNASQNYTHTEIVTPIAILTVHSVQKTSKPRSAKYRDLLYDGMQMNWFSDLFGGETLNRLPYFYVTHEYDKSNFRLKDTRIMLAQPEFWIEPINESIFHKDLSVEHVALSHAPAVKEEIIVRSSIPGVKKGI